MGIPLQQTKLWQSFLTDLGETSFFHTEKSFTYLATLKSTPFGNYLYCPYGPHSDTKSGFKKALEALKTLAKSKSAIFIRIEPQSPQIAQEALNSANAKKVIDLTPAHTMLLDLSPSKDQLVANFSQTTRNRFNTSAKRGITITNTKNPDDLTHLIRFQSAVARSRHFHAFSPKYLKTELNQPFATLYLAHFSSPIQNPTTQNPKNRAQASSKSQNQPKTPSNKSSFLEKPETTPPNTEVVGASLFFDHANTRYYMQSGTDLDPKYKNLSANVSILGTAILDAKEKGLKFFDFWGIAPENAPKNHPWAGFTKFKKTFGGFPVAYCGTHDIILNPLKYHLYQSARKLNRLARKLVKN